MEKVEQAKNAARTRIGLGAAVILASVLVPQQCGPNSSSFCDNMETAARVGGAAAGVSAIYSGIKKYGDVKVHAEALAELARSFENESKGQVVEVEGRQLRLTGTAEEQYREWRKLIAEWYRSESGAPPPSAAPAGPAPAAGSANTAPAAGAAPKQ